MSQSLSRCLLGAVAITLGMFAQSAGAQTAMKPPVIIDKHLAPGCINSPNGKVHDPKSDTNIPHQYMLLLIFKKGQGSQYFGGANDNEYGCIQDAPSTLIVAPMMQLMTENCPNDCVYPYGRRPASDNGSDPLNVDPAATNRWGILSAVDTADLNGGPKRKVEIWQVAVTDACHARRLYAYHTKDPKSLLNQAYANGDMFGEVLVGYPGKDYGDAASRACTKM